MQKLLLAVVAVIAIAHLFATRFGWYYSYPLMDIPMHIAGGIFVGLLFFYLFAIRHDTLPNAPPLALAISAVGFVMLVGVLWEMYEFILDVYVHQTQTLFGASGYLLFDTLKDLLDDLVGSGIAVVIFFRFFRDRTAR